MAQRRAGTVADAKQLAGSGELGVCYLLHFEPSYKHAGRYFGWTRVREGETARDAVRRRLAVHLAGDGSPLVKAAKDAGCLVVIARVWEDVDRHFERATKRSKNVARLDPISNGTLSLVGAIEANH